VTTGLIVPAAGRGERLGAGRPKAMHLLAGEPLLVHAVRGALAAGVVDVVVVAVPADLREEVAALLAGEVAGSGEHGRPPGTASGAVAPVVEAARLAVVAGGAERRDSVAAALRSLPVVVDTVLVHDAARCLTPPEVFAVVAKEVAAGSPAVIPVLPVTDTIKRVDGGVVAGTPDRSALRVVQTPQGFRRDLLERAHATVSGAVTDDAGLVERLGVPVRVVPGHEDAFKITRPMDLVLAEAVVRRRREAGR
jgi:2-C-methyl-D-erythritol 4-phosphate cytidylyltransferase